MTGPTTVRGPSASCPPDSGRKDLEGRIWMDDERDERRERFLRELVNAADRLESLADTAELMDDDDGAARFRAEASRRRLRAMALLDR